MWGAHATIEARNFGSYALLNVFACLILAMAIPHLAQDARDVVASEFADSPPRLPNLVEKRRESSKRPAPSADLLARLPAAALPSVPLSGRADVLELVSDTQEEAIPLADALDAAESLPVKALKPLHKPRYRALYADLMRRDAARKLAQASDKRTVRVAQRLDRIPKRTVAALETDRDLSAGTIAQRNITNSLAFLTP